MEYDTAHNRTPHAGSVLLTVSLCQRSQRSHRSVSVQPRRYPYQSVPRRRSLAAHALHRKQTPSICCYGNVPSESLLHA